MQQIQNNEAIASNIADIAKNISLILEHCRFPIDENEVRTIINTEIGKNKFDPKRFIEKRYFYSSDVAHVGLPILYLIGDFTTMSKEKKNDIIFRYGNEIKGYTEGTCTCKWQGNSSLAYPKKNFTIAKLSPKLNVGWGEQKKYCLKANFTDHSMALNIVNARLWGDIVKSRQNEDTVVAKLLVAPNCGAIDGFPIILYINNIFHGLYTFNIPKDGWMMGMGSGSAEALLASENMGEYREKVFLDHITEESLKNETNFSVVYASDEDNISWIVESFNKMVDKVSDYRNTNYEEIIENYVDLKSFIDYYIFTVLIGNNDALYANFLLGTFNGTKWFISAYDLDITFGLEHLGKGTSDPYSEPSFKSIYEKALQEKANILFKHIYENKKELLKTRFFYLRTNVLSEAAVFKKFSDFIKKIPLPISNEDAYKWEKIPCSNLERLAYFSNWYNIRCKHVDIEVASL